MRRWVLASACTVTSGAVLLGGAPAASGQALTYVTDVAPIVREKCLACHSDGSIAPIELTSYDRVRHHSHAVRAQVADRRMPPWHVDPSVGVRRFANDHGLTEEERRTILDWIDGGTPYGRRGARAPDPAPAATDGFRLAAELGEPDLVLRSEAYTPESRTQDGWFRTATPTGLPERRWLRALEVRAVGPRTAGVVHHALVFLDQQPEDDPRSFGPLADSPRGGAMGGPGLLAAWSAAARGEVLGSGRGKLLLPGSRIRWALSVAAPGEEAPGGRCGPGRHSGRVTAARDLASRAGAGAGPPNPPRSLRRAGADRAGHSAR